jgi:outer membrane biosynthesis protein TonB
MTTQLTARTSAGSRHQSTGAAGTGARRGTGSTRTAAGVRGRALLAALGLALAAAVLPATAAHASPQSPDVKNQFANPGGNPQPPEPPDPPQWGPEDVANPTENPEPPLPPEPPDVPDWGPDDIANPTENPEPPEPPDGPDDLVNPTDIPEPPNPTGDPDPSGDSIPTPERVDAGFGGAAIGSHQAAGLALIAAAVVLALLLGVLARRHRAEARSAR